MDEGYDVHAVYVDLGQPCEDREAILKKARDIGAKSARIVDAREELCRDFAFPVLQWQAKYEGMYLLGTSIARPLISKVCLQVAREVGADAYAHGATGKGNDQCRFQLAAEALDPQVKIIAPWRIEKFRQTFPGRTEMIAYCDAERFPVKASVAKPYSSDENCLHISYEAGKLEDPAVNGVDVVDFGMTVSPQQAPDKVETVTIGFESGIPVRVNGKPLSPLAIVTELNNIGGRNGIGRIDMVENRFVGMKSRGVYEAPGMTILYAAHRVIEQLTLDRDLVHLRDRLVAGSRRDGVLRLLVRGQDGRAVGVHPPGPAAGHRRGDARSLQRATLSSRAAPAPTACTTKRIATMEGGGSYNQTDAEGFLRLQGLPSRVLGKVRQRE